MIIIFFLSDNDRKLMISLLVNYPFSPLFFELIKFYCDVNGLIYVNTPLNLKMRVFQQIQFSLFANKKRKEEKGS